MEKEKDKEPNKDTTIAIKKIFQRVEQLPKVIQTDNRKEFDRVFHLLLTNKDEQKGSIELEIRHIQSRSYTPTVQDQVEWANQNIKSILRKHFILNNTRN